MRATRPGQTIAPASLCKQGRIHGRPSESKHEPIDAIRSGYRMFLLLPRFCGAVVLRFCSHHLRWSAGANPAAPVFSSPKLAAAAAQAARRNPQQRGQPQPQPCLPSTSARAYLKSVEIHATILRLGQVVFVLVHVRVRLSLRRRLRAHEQADHTSRVLFLCKKIWKSA